MQVLKEKSSPRTKLDTGVVQELLLLIAQQSDRLPIPIFLAMVLLAAISASHVSIFLWGPWLILILCLLLLRRAVIQQLPNRSDLSDQAKLRIITFLSGANGVSQSLIVWVFPYFSETEKAITTFVMMGLCAGAMGITVGYLPMFCAYLFTMLLPLAFAWLLTEHATSGPFVSITLFVIILLFVGVLTGLSKDLFALFRKSIDIRTEQRETNQKLTHALSDASKANRSKSRFLAAASHDLRQPIHTLSLFSASLSMRPLDERTQAISDHISSAVDSLANQMDTLLDISKLDAGVVEISNEPMILNTMCARLKDEFEVEASEKGLSLTLVSNEVFTVISDPIQLERVLRNLLANSLKYTASGKIEIMLSSNNQQQVLLSISDTGIGMEEKQLNLIFEEFYQIDNPERDRDRGLGLGLSIVDRLCQLMRVPYKVDSTIGEGTRFTLYLSKLESSVRKQPIVEVERPRLNGLKILVLDDEEMVREAMSTLLQAQGVEVKCCEHTQAALDYIKTENFDLVLLDYRLRGVETGVSALEQIRLIHPDLPAIIISGDTNRERLLEAKKLNLPFLHKPVDATLLSNTIARLLANKEAPNVEHG